MGESKIAAYDISGIDLSQLKYENNLLANNILDRHFYSYFRNGQKKIEIFLSGVCKANCEYCYLKKYHENLYPTKIEKYDTVINNFKAFLDWYVDSKFSCIIDFFSGEWLTTKYRDAIFDLMYDKFKDESQYKPKTILIPDNMQFIKDEKAFNKVKEILLKFKSIGIYVNISASVDGKYCDDGRTTNTDEYYDTLIEFCKEHSFKFHPMVSSSNVKNWIENYKWWMDILSKHDYEYGKDIMMLEVRDQTWTNESIEQLLEFINFVADYNFDHKFNKDKKRYLASILRRKEEVKDNCYDNTSLVFDSAFVHGQDFISCSASPETLPIRMGDLSIAICHRTWYPELTIGHFNKIDNKISDFTVDNIGPLFIKIAAKKSCFPHCESCPLIGFCPGFCMGNAYEVSKNLLCPPKPVCNMYKAKTSFLIKKYNDMGLFNYIDDLVDKNNEEEVLFYSYIKTLINNVLNNLEG